MAYKLLFSIFLLLCIAVTNEARTEVRIKLGSGTLKAGLVRNQILSTMYRSELFMYPWITKISVRVVLT